LRTNPFDVQVKELKHASHESTLQLYFAYPFQVWSLATNNLNSKPTIESHPQKTLKRFTKRFAEQHKCTYYVRTITKKFLRMNQIYNTQAPKKPTNVSINSDLLAQAKELKINLSATLENALTDLVNAKQQELWKQKNKIAIEAYNQLVDENGVFGDDLRSF